MNLDINKISTNLAFFRYKKLGKNYLLTNEVGEYAMLTEPDFDKFVAGKLNKKTKLYAELAQKRFIKNKLDLDAYADDYKKKNSFLFHGPTLHILVTTLNCNYACNYCQVSSKNRIDKKFNMDLATAKQVVDFIFQSPSKSIAIEFQGGEPLLNWDVVKFVTEYAKEKNKQEKKELELRLVSNLSLMTKERLDFCFKKGVSICTSLDGPENVHNRNRPCAGKNSYQETTKWLKIALEKYDKIDKNKKKVGSYKFQPGALVTISQYSLDYPKEIVNEYLRWGFETISLRPVSPLGMAGKIWPQVGYDAEAFLKFYANALDYIIKLNFSGKKFYERTATIFLAKILTGEDPNYMELRSPCGAGIGQLAYDYNGDIYTCDEGRMLGQLNDKLFRLGNIADDRYSSIMESQTLKSVCLASELNSQPVCSQCVYAPYCGVCPIYNYVTQGTIFARQGLTNQRCLINTGVIDILFDRMQNKKIKKLFTDWAHKEINRQ